MNPFLKNMLSFESRKNSSQLLSNTAFLNCFSFFLKPEMKKKNKTFFTLLNLLVLMNTNRCVSVNL